MNFVLRVSKIDPHLTKLQENRRQRKFQSDMVRRIFSFGQYNLLQTSKLTEKRPTLS